MGAGRERERHTIRSCDEMCKGVFAIATMFFFATSSDYISRATSGSVIVNVVPSPFDDALA